MADRDRLRGRCGRRGNRRSFREQFFQPSEKAKAAGAAVERDISLKPGERVTVRMAWQARPGSSSRTPEQLAELPKLDPQLADPDPSASPTNSRRVRAQCHRSIKPGNFVAVGICLHLGCSPTEKSSWVHSPRCPTTGRAAFCALPWLHLRHGWPRLQEQAVAPTTCRSAAAHVPVRRACSWRRQESLRERHHG